MMPFESRFLERLRKELVGDLQKIHGDLGGGTTLKPSADETALATSRQVGRIEGLQMALDRMNYINDVMSGRKKETS